MSSYVYTYPYTKIQTNIRMSLNIIKFIAICVSLSAIIFSKYLVEAIIYSVFLLPI